MSREGLDKYFGREERLDLTDTVQGGARFRHDLEVRFKGEG